jgi:RNA polymerase sigma-70 factor (ECF subfamily)
MRVLIDRYRDELLRFLIRFMGDRQAAEDVFQETFLQIHLSADTFDTSRRLKPWLFTIAANKGRDLHRKNAKRSALELSAEVDGDSGPQFVDLMEIETTRPLDAMQSREREERVQAAVRDLPEHYREILLLAYFQKMTYAQLAEVLQIPLGTVKSRLHAAVAAFARSWKDVWAEREGDAGPDATPDSGESRS